MYWLNYVSPRKVDEELGWRAFVWLDDHFKQPAKVTLFSANETQSFPLFAELMPEGVTPNPNSDQVSIERWRFQMATVLLAAFILPPNPPPNTNNTNNNIKNHSYESESSAACWTALAELRELILQEMAAPLGEEFQTFLEKLKTSVETDTVGTSNLAMFRSLLERSLVVTEHVRVKAALSPL